MKKSEKGNTFIVVLFVLIAILVLFFPKIYSVIETAKLPKIEKTKETNKEGNKEVTDEVIESLHFPLMRTSIYNKDTYYSLDTFKISDMKNGDILYNAFLDIYEGNMVSENPITKCAVEGKSFDANYLELRIKNILGKDVKYTLENFVVPEDSSSKYKGEWFYYSSDSKFHYASACTPQTTENIYYNLEEFIKAEYDNDDVIVYYYVGFAKAGQAIYSDANMTNELKKTNSTDINALKEEFKSIDNKYKKIYKYTFKNTLCTYDEYCLYKGEWVDSVK